MEPSCGASFATRVSARELSVPRDLFWLARGLLGLLGVVPVGVGLIGALILEHFYKKVHVTWGAGNITRIPCIPWFPNSKFLGVRVGLEIKIPVQW